MKDGEPMRVAEEREKLGDPERGLALRASLKKRLERTLTAAAKGVPVERAAHDIGLEW